MTRGNDLEPLCIKWAIDRTGINYETPEEMFVAESDDGSARMIATLDGFYEDNGTRYVLEIKTLSQPFDGELFDYWRIQGIQQAICADVDHITWGIFDSTMAFHIVRQDVSADEKAEHVEAVSKWLTCIDLGITPEGVSWSYETISTRYAKPEPTTVELPATAEDLVAQLKHVKRELKGLNELEDKLKAELCELMGQNEYATVNGTIIATWKGRTWQSLDIKTLKAMEPDLANKYSKPVTTRTLLLKGEK
jgi:hypothetical protein